MSNPNPAGSGVDPETHEVTPPVPGPGAPAEPVLSAATVVTAVTAILAMLVSFGLPVDNDQQSAILGAIAVVVPIILGLIARSKAWAPRTVRQTVQAEVAKATRTQPPTGGTY